jgi:ribulose 1,5-bisphosphate synthetase/thiazole synthase
MFGIGRRTWLEANLQVVARVIEERPRFGLATKPVNEPDVLIVGAGPAGLVTVITLARYGVNVLLVEKRTAISTLSRATVISTPSMEIFRSWGLKTPYAKEPRTSSPVAGSRPPLQPAKAP